MNRWRIASISFGFFICSLSIYFSDAGSWFEQIWNSGGDGIAVSMDNKLIPEVAAVKDTFTVTVVER